jgi:multiple sugar transport system substrate-binding protein
LSLSFGSRDPVRRGVSRRSLLVGSAVGALAVLVAACGGTQATPTAQPTAPSSAAPTAAPSAGATAAASGAPRPVGPSIKGQSLAFLGGSYFIPDAQKLFVSQLQKWGTDNGVNVSADFLNWTDLQAKIAAAVQSGAGADMFEMWPGWGYLYADHLADVSEVADGMAKAQGGFYDSWVTPAAQVGGKWLGVPTGTSNIALNYRISYLKQAGIDDPEKNFPATWEELFAVGAKLKSLGKPIGQALGHSTGDPPSFAYPYMWSYGAMEVEKDGKTVAFNKPEFVDAMKRFIQAWKDAYDTSALAGDDAYNNRAFLADQISITLNGTSIYYTALKQNPDIAADMTHTDIPAGPAGRFYNFGSHSYGILKESKNVEAAKAFLTWWTNPAQFGDWIHIQATYQIPPTKQWENDPMWTSDPKTAAVRNDAKYGRPLGYAGPLNEKAALANSKYIVVDTFSRAIQSGDAAEAIKWGADQLQQIYDG